MNTKTHLLIIDPQNDFCDPKKGTLYVPGADEDMLRLAGFVRERGATISQIHVTLDSHHVWDIAHPVWWQDEVGNAPAPFTIIREAEITSGVWRARKSADQERSADYVAQLAKNGRYPLCIWPYHCLIGSTGHAVVPELFAALTEWEEGGKSVDYIAKGANPYTEHYSAIQADVIDPLDPQTQVNTVLVDSLAEADRVYIAGEAGSHCVANTVRDLERQLSVRAKRPTLILLTDTLSPVPGFEALQADFLVEMQGLGMQTENISSI
jgi:nicotinamidase/pyrazinamidase